MSEMVGGEARWGEVGRGGVAGREHFSILFLMSPVEAVSTSENNFLIRQNCATVWCSFSSCCVLLK